MSKTGAEYIGSTTKRRLDLYGGLAIAALMVAPAGVIAPATMWEHRTTHPLFDEERNGTGNRPFTCRKFKTLDKPSKSGQPEVPFGGSNHPDAHDFDIAIRRRGLDEIPQILDVIAGRISLVGIRPLAQRYKDYYESFIPADQFSEWDEISLLNTGLTGVGQLYGKQFPVHDQAVIKKQVALEIAAFDHSSLINDVRIVRATAGLLLRPDQVVLPHIEGVA
jgi:lipopolysaccharide/colanic/teichoic acid biosynthesis glycosyltransferase